MSHIIKIISLTTLLLAFSITAVFAQSDKSRGRGNNSNASTENSQNAQKFKKRVQTGSATNSATIRTKVKDEENINTNVRLDTGERVRIRTKNGESTVDVFSKGTKVKFEFLNGQLTATTESEAEEIDDIELDQGEILSQIEEELNQDGIGIATESGNIVLLHRGRSATRTTFPLSVDLDTNELIVTTPAGVKRVAVLPDQAINNLIKDRVFDEVEDDDEENDATESGQLANVSSIYDLEEEDDEIKYTIRGKSHQTLLGIIPVEIQKTVEISAETGEVIAQHQSLLSRLLDFFSN